MIMTVNGWSRYCSLEEALEFVNFIKNEKEEDIIPKVVIKRWVCPRYPYERKELV